MISPGGRIVLPATSKHLHFILLCMTSARQGVDNKITTRAVCFTLFLSNETQASPVIVPKSASQTSNTDKSFLLAATERLVHTLDALIANGKLRYYIFQLERCPSTGRAHFQGYVQYARSSRPLRLKTLLSEPSLHVELARGSPAENVQYCSKATHGMWTQNLRSAGELTSQGTRSDLTALTSLLLQRPTISWRELIKEHTNHVLMYHRGIAFLRAHLVKPRSWKTQVTVLWGPPGTGKSRVAHEIFPGAYCLNPPRGSSNFSAAWWDSYDFEQDVIIDEFYGWIPYAQFLATLDRYPLLVETKGGSVQFLAKRIIITTNRHPSTWYKFAPRGSEPYAALRRRIGRIIHVENSINYSTLLAYVSARVNDEPATPEEASVEQEGKEESPRAASATKETCTPDDAHPRDT